MTVSKHPKHQPLSELSPAHRQLLELLADFRFATTHQLVRLTQENYANRRSARRQVLRHLKQLRGQGLVAGLERRVGGWQAGSAVTIWTLTTSGNRLITGKTKRLRPKHLSTTFLEHSLAVTETLVLIAEAVAGFGGKAMAVSEPDCWRTYLTGHGSPVRLKPDLYLKVETEQFTDRYFIEVDRATENPGRVIKKCWQYETYRRTGLEQKHAGVYPAVVWVVPSTRRRDQLRQHLEAEDGLPRNLFWVITPDELADLLINGPPD